MTDELPNYEKIFNWLLANKKLITRGKLTKLHIQHDTWCGMLYGKRCDCQPDFLVDGEKISYPKELLK